MARHWSTRQSHSPSDVRRAAELTARWRGSSQLRYAITHGTGSHKNDDKSNAGVTRRAVCRWPTSRRRHDTRDAVPSVGILRIMRRSSVEGAVMTSREDAVPSLYRETRGVWCLNSSSNARRLGTSTHQIIRDPAPPPRPAACTSSLHDDNSDPRQDI